MKKRGYKVKTNTTDVCERCVRGKQCRTTYHFRPYRAEKPGEVIHTDVCGPMENKSLGGTVYFLCFKDDWSKYRHVFFLSHKSEVPACLETFLAEVRIAVHTVKLFRADQGREFDNEKVIKILNSYGIERRLSPPYSKEQNGAAEREDRTLVESALVLCCRLENYLECCGRKQ